MEGLWIVVYWCVHLRSLYNKVQRRQAQRGGVSQALLATSGLPATARQLRQPRQPTQSDSNTPGDYTSNTHLQQELQRLAGDAARQLLGAGQVQRVEPRRAAAHLRQRGAGLQLPGDM